MKQIKMAHLVSLAPDSDVAVLVVSHTAGPSVVAYYLQDSELRPRILKPDDDGGVICETPDSLQRMLMGVDLLQVADDKIEIKFRSPFDVCQKMFLVRDIDGNPAAVTFVEEQLCRVDTIHADVSDKSEALITLHGRCAESGLSRSVTVTLDLSMLPDLQHFL